MSCFVLVWTFKVDQNMSLVPTSRFDHEAISFLQPVRAPVFILLLVLVVLKWSDLEEVCDGGDVAGTGALPGIWDVLSDLKERDRR